MADQHAGIDGSGRCAVHRPAAPGPPLLHRADRHEAAAQEEPQRAGIARGDGSQQDLTEAESVELMAFTQKAIRVIKSVSNPMGFNVGLNLGQVSGGSLAEHLHMHVVPRWVGDANFITIIGGSKVVPQLLRETRQLLATEWAKRQ